MTREQLVDAVKCTTQTASCKDCTFPSDNDHGCFELLAQEAIAQMDRAERWKSIAIKALSAVNIYDDGDGDRQMCVIDAVMDEALEDYKQAMEQEAKQG